MVSCAAVVALRISLTGMRAFLLDEDSFQRRACSSVGDHDLLGVVQNMRISTRAWVLLLMRVLASFAFHDALVHVRAVAHLAFVVASINGWSHCASLFRRTLSFH